MHLSYGPDLYIARMLVMLSFVAAKVAKAFFAGVYRCFNYFYRLHN
jgi:hypothetical protein